MGYSQSDAAQMSIQTLDISNFLKEAQFVYGPEKHGVLSDLTYNQFGPEANSMFHPLVSRNVCYDSATCAY